MLRKGRRRTFTTAAEKAKRRESAFFWEERNVWFSDVWLDVKGTSQGLVDAPTRERSAAFPFELAYRLVCMFSVKEDWVLDPFAGTGTTLAAALTAGRNSVGVEIDETLVRAAQSLLCSTRSVANEYNRARLARHAEWAAVRTEENGPLKYASRHYGFPVMTAQEQDLLLNEVTEIADGADGMTLVAQYSEKPQAYQRESKATAPPESITDAAAARLTNRSCALLRVACSAALHRLPRNRRAQHFAL